MRIAVIADVHGNSLALAAVLAELRGAGADLLVNLGDLVSGPFDPRASAGAQMALDAATLAGNHERQVLNGGSGALDVLARERLDPAHLDWMAGLPPTLSLADGEVFACHGSPAGGDDDYLLEDIDAGRTVLAAEAAILPRLAGVGAARLVLCGHTHTPRVVAVGGVLVVNPGSVGMPAYRAGPPVPHVVEAGAPHARYAVVERRAGGWAAELRAVPYDAEAAARQAEALGFAGLAHAARTGRLPPA
ncbi:metallophosphoesterase family protein [Ancylobacter lacus]|uniref:metallophosphoesterase family protein n=1 Tax=Ancylobacter lacus TaxID=2579970 RepID=UPI001BCF3CBD|nr:metallophosphoesterase family protein [Ancylobacter lacus]MBS7540185.1 metallophosphoesterase family protein [Ancylobacter lacus]